MRPSQCFPFHGAQRGVGIHVPCHDSGIRARCDSIREG